MFARRSLTVPGPSTLSVRQAVEFGRDPYAYLSRCHAEYGDVFTLQLPRDPIRVVACAPEDVTAIFALEADAFRSDQISLHLNLGERSVLFADGERHRRQRQMIAPSMHMAKLRSYAEAMLSLTDASIDRLAVGEVFTGYGFFREIALNVILQTVFGVDPDSAKGHTVTRHLVDWLETALTPGMFGLSLAMRGVVFRHALERRTMQAREGEYGRDSRIPWRKVARAKADLLAELRCDVARCRAEGTGDRNDVLALLVDARYDDGSSMEEEEIMDQLVTLLVGGFETTANSLVWAWFHMLPEAEVCDRVRGELEDRFGADGVDPNRCGELPFLDACIRESMRLSPISVASTRELTRPMTLGGHEIPAGTIVWPCTYLAQRRPDAWPDPERFDPSRFLDAKAPKPNVFFPFGGGRRRCLGATYALFEMRIVLARVFERCELALLSENPRPELAGIAVSPADDLRLRLVRRR